MHAVLLIWMKATRFRMIIPLHRQECLKLFLRVRIIANPLALVLQGLHSSTMAYLGIIAIGSRGPIPEDSFSVP